MIYGGGGAIGGAVAEMFTREGAQVFLAGRTGEKLEAAAERIRAAAEPRESRSSTRSMSRLSISMPTMWRRRWAGSTSRSI